MDLTLAVVIWVLLAGVSGDERLDQTISRILSQWGHGKFTAFVVLHTPGAVSNEIRRALQRAAPYHPISVTGMLRGPSQHSLWPGKLERILILVDDEEDLSTFLDFASEDDNWNPRAKVILILSSNTNMETALQITWQRRYQLYNTLAVQGNNVSTLLPLPQPDCGRTKLVHLPATAPLFTSKFSNFGGCSLTVANLNLPPHFFTPGTKSLGVSAKMLEIVSKELNFRYVLVPPSRGKGLDDKLFLQTVIRILNNHIDISPFAISPEVGEFCYNFGWSGISIAVPKAEYLPIWMNLIIPFQKEVWLTSLLFLIFETILQFIFLPNDTFWPSFTSKLGVSSTQHAPTFTSARIFLMNMFLSGIVLNTAYHSALYQSLTLLQRYPDINTLYEILDTDLPVVGFKVIRFYMQKSNTSVYDKLVERYAPSNRDPFQDLKYLVRYRNTSYASDSLFLKYAQKMLTRENYEFHTVERIASVLNSFIVPFGSLYIEEFNKIIRKVIQSGLFFKWEKDLMKIKTSELSINFDSSLSIKHFTSAFWALVIGYSASFVILVGEIIFYWVTNKLRGQDKIQTISIKY